MRFDRSLLEQSAAAAGNEAGDLTGRKRRADVAPAEPQVAAGIPLQLRLHIPPLLKKVVLDDSIQVGRVLSQAMCQAMSRHATTRSCQQFNKLCYMLGGVAAVQVNAHGNLLPLPRNSHGRPTVNEILQASTFCLEATARWPCACSRHRHASAHLTLLRSAGLRGASGKRHVPAAGCTGTAWFVVIALSTCFTSRLMCVPRCISPHGMLRVTKLLQAVAEVLSGLRHYFDQCLYQFLLYSHELQQADEVLSGVPGACF